MPDTEVRELLEAWRAAVRDAEWYQSGTPERVAADLKVRDYAERYRVAALRMKARLDQLEGTAASTSERIARSQGKIWSRSERPEDPAGPERAGPGGAA